MLLIRSILKALFLPPSLFILAGLAGLLLLKWRPRIARGLLLFSLFGLYLFSTPALVGFQSSSLEDHLALNMVDKRIADADAIVVLGGGIRSRPTEYGGDVLKVGTLNRLHEGVRWHNRTGLPMLLTGGVGLEIPVSEAQLMEQTLRDYYGVEASWLEQRSRTTWENARYSAEILLPAGMRKIVLVTHASHIDRAIYSFENFGFEVIPAPMGYSSSRMDGWALTDFIPRASAFDLNYKLMHERVGLIVYRLMYE